ncbi:MAG: hypothetical protein ACT6FG_05315 [Methanosarcinaceae archaeon]
MNSEFARIQCIQNRHGVQAYLTGWHKPTFKSCLKLSVCSRAGGGDSPAGLRLFELQAARWIRLPIC